MMTLPSDQELAKLRIKYHMARRGQEAANKEALRCRRHCEAAWADYRDHIMRLGYCPWCELRQSECRGHVCMGTPLDTLLQPWNRKIGG